MLIELLFLFGIIMALWYIDFCNPPHRATSVNLCKTSPPPNPATLYVPFPRPRDTHTSDKADRVYDDGTRIA